ncbi:MgtC/SapB family protein [Paenarthrobacter sp. NPDC056912]|uniref:MgtC/SapB family protein n=1 Tax=Paenarthrobacter sp. NPDC056912 TaxID=3345965 RepID=UPI00366D149F
MTFSAELFDLSLRVIISLLLGASIGLERQWRSRMAGIRTNALVAGGSALFVVMGAYSFGGIGADPTRVAAQIVSGIGFLGAGVIMREGLNVRGLNTAATLWCAAAVGSLAGSGLYLIAILGALCIVGVNTLLRPVGRMINRHPRRTAGDIPSTADVGYLLEATTDGEGEGMVRSMLVQAISRPGFSLQSMSTRGTKNALVKVRAELSASTEADIGALERTVKRLSLDPKIYAVRWRAEDSEEE